MNKALWQLRTSNGLTTFEEVAVKSLHDESTDEDKVKFLQEAAIMAQFNQPNILRVLGMIVENEHKVSCFEWIMICTLLSEKQVTLMEVLSVR